MGGFQKGLLKLSEDLLGSWRKGEEPISLLFHISLPLRKAEQEQHRVLESGLDVR